MCGRDPLRNLIWAATAAALVAGCSVGASAVSTTTTTTTTFRLPDGKRAFQARGSVPIERYCLFHGYFEKRREDGQVYLKEPADLVIRNREHAVCDRVEAGLFSLLFDMDSQLASEVVQHLQSFPIAWDSASEILKDRSLRQNFGSALKDGLMPDTISRIGPDELESFYLFQSYAITIRSQLKKGNWAIETVVFSQPDSVLVR